MGNAPGGNVATDTGGSVGKIAVCGGVVCGGGVESKGSIFTESIHAAPNLRDDDKKTGSMYHVNINL